MTGAGENNQILGTIMSRETGTLKRLTRWPSSMVSMVHRYLDACTWIFCVQLEVGKVFVWFRGRCQTTR